jgi:hypothetical protein
LEIPKLSKKVKEIFAVAAIVGAKIKKEGPSGHLPTCLFLEYFL